jgi:hypothetical protein
MSSAYDTLYTHFDVLSMPDYDGISRRFQQSFESFVTAKKYQAVRAILREEVQHESLVKNPELIQAIVNRVDEEALLEKRFIFISVNTHAPV